MQVVDLLTESLAKARTDASCRDVVEALDSLRIAIAIFDDQDRLTYWNDHLTYVFQSFKTLGSLQGMSYQKLLRCKLENNEIAGSRAITDPEGWIKHKLNLRRTPSVAPSEERLSDGRWIRIDERALNDGGTIRAYTDITASIADHYRFLSAIEDGRDAMSFWDQRDRLSMYNDTFATLFDAPGMELKIGMRFSELLEIAADSLFSIGDQEPGEWIRERLRQHRLPDHQEVWRHRDGRWFLANEHRSRDGSIVARFSDVSAIKENELAIVECNTNSSGTVHELEMSKSAFERQSAEHVRALEDLSKAKTDLEAANASRSRFLSIISHELRTPMNAIIGFSEILEKEMLGPLGNAKYSEYAADIFASGQHLLSLINDLLDMSKVDAGHWQLNRSPVDVNALIRSCCRIMSELAAEAEVCIELSVADDIGTAYLDERAIRQVLLNLLSNALKFTARNGLIRVSAWSDGEALLLAIADNGVGIHEKDLARVFKPFEQGENNLSRAHEGSGLGLSLCKSLVELHGGAIRLDSRVGMGTTVTFQIPLSSDRVHPA